MSSLLSEIEVEVLKITFIKKSDASTSVYYFAKDFWAAEALYSGSPVIYPLLASSPTAKRGVGINVGIKYDVSIQLHGNSDFYNRDFGLVDFLKLYEVQNASIEIRYYCKPKYAVTTHADGTNIRQTLKGVDASYDDSSGILTVRARDVWFKDKEVSKKLSSNIFSDIDTRFDGIYGAIVFGQATTAANGIAIEAPFISSSVNGSSVPVAKIFSGWTFAGILNSAKRRLLCKSQTKYRDRNDWTLIALASDPQTSGGGDSAPTPAADPVSHDRDLSINERGYVHGTSSTHGVIVTAVRAGLAIPSYDRCMDIASTQYLSNQSNDDFLSRGDEDFSFSFWINADNLNGTLALQGWDDTGKLEWILFWNSSTLQFSISSGSGIAHSVNSATLSTGTWYYVTCVYDTSVNNKIYMYINTTATNTTVTTFIAKHNGRFGLGRLSANTSYDGKMYQFRYWRRALGSTEITALYNAGTPIFYKDLTDENKIELVSSWPLNEPVGTREDEHGSADLVQGAQSGNSPIIRYNYSNKAITINNQFGELALEAWHCESLDGGQTYFLTDGILRKTTIDLTKTNVGTGALLTTGTTGVYFQIDTPLVLNEFANYMFLLRFNNSKTNTYYVLCYYDANTATFTHMVKNKRSIVDGTNISKEAFSLVTSASLDMQVYTIGDGDNAWFNGTTTGTDRYSYQDLEAKSITLMTDMQHKEFNQDLEFKICIDGLLDDSSGTYTGTVSSLMQNPSDIIRFTVISTDFGVGVSAASVDTSAMTSVRTSLSNFGLAAAKIVIKSQTFAEDFIAEICRQFRIIFYTNKQGKPTLKYPTPITSYSYVLHESNLRGDMQLVSVADNDYSTVINEAIQFYNPDLINVPDQPNLSLEAREKLAGKLELSPTTSTLSDTARQATLTTSQSKYGKRQMNFPLSYFDTALTASKVQNYYLDRYSSLQKRGSIRIPRKDYLALDLFNNVLISHTGIESSLYTESATKTHHAGTKITEYHEGVPILSWSGGQLSGQVYEIEEEGSWIKLTAETVSTFES